jgi:hypothetical protein
MTLCKYKREGSVWGHWCNECPPLPEYLKIERAEQLAWALRNKGKDKKK